jgi:hypothetical protein
MLNAPGLMVTTETSVGGGADVCASDFALHPAIAYSKNKIEPRPVKRRSELMNISHGRGIAPSENRQPGKEKLMMKKAFILEFCASVFL